MNAKNNQYQLKELVVKLNDRNIQRRRESGLTNYAVYLVLIYIVFYLVDNGSKIFDSPKLSDHVVVLTLVGNLVFCLSYFVISEINQRTLSGTKIFPNQEFLSIDSTAAPYILFFTVYSILNVYSFFVSYSHSKVYLAFGLVMTTNVLLPLGAYLASNWKNRHNRVKLPNFSNFTSRKDVQNTIKKATVLIGITFAVFLIWLILVENVSLKKEKLSESITYSIHCIGILICIGILQTQFVQKHFNERLEALEIEIYLKSMTNEEIKQKLEEEYLGQDFKTWVEAKKRQTIRYLGEETEKLASILAHIQRYRTEPMEVESKETEFDQLFYERQDIIKRVQKHTDAFAKLLSYLHRYSSIEGVEWQYLFELQNHYDEELTKLNAIDHVLYDFFSANHQYGKS